MDLYVDEINTNLDNREITPSNDMAAPLNSYNSNNINTPEYNNIHNNTNPYTNEKIENLTLYYNNYDCCFPKKVIIMNNINKFTFVESGYCGIYCMIIFSILFSLAWIILTIILADFGLYFFISLVVGLLPPIFPLLFGFFINFKIILSLENDSLSITKKRLFRDVNIIFKRDKCERIEMEYIYNSSPEAASTHNFYFSLILKSGVKIEISKIRPRTENIEIKGINYMLNIINSFISNNMK